MRRLLLSMGALYFLLVAGMLSGSCGADAYAEDPRTPMSFNQHLIDATQNVKNNRSYQTDDLNLETSLNVPRQWIPEKDPKGSVLLVHGLGDSPSSMNDIASFLSVHGYLVRTILLPGHGTDPADLLGTSRSEWIDLLNAQVHSLKEDSNGSVFLGGFSSGASLVLNYAYRDSNIDGLLLFSPGFKSKSFDWLAPLASKFRPWVISPNSKIPMMEVSSYINMPTNGYAQFYLIGAQSRKAMSNIYEKPVFMVVSENDTILDTQYLLEIFQEKFVNAKSRLVWYGSSVKGSERIVVRPDKIEEKRISQFSHSSVIYSPENTLHGQEGGRVCLNGLTSDERETCEKSKHVWYSGWGYREPGKIHAKLTYNPYFEWQSEIMMSVMDVEQPSFRN